MGNPNYQRGVRFERALMKEFKEELGIKKKGCLSNKNGLLIRASGSHGEYDVVYVNHRNKEVIFVQCKVVKGEGPRSYVSLRNSDEYDVSFMKATEYVR